MALVRLCLCQCALAWLCLRLCLLGWLRLTQNSGCPMNAPAIRPATIPLTPRFRPTSSFLEAPLWSAGAKRG